MALLRTSWEAKLAETWQTGVSAEGCGTPVTPHNGSNAATWTVDETNKTVTVKGDGAFLGLARFITQVKMAIQPTMRLPMFMKCPPMEPK